MAWKRGACAGATGRKSPWSSLPLPEGASEFVPHYAVAVAVDGRFSIGCGTIALVLGGEGRHKGRVRIQIDGGVPVPIGEVDQIAGIHCDGLSDGAKNYRAVRRLGHRCESKKRERTRAPERD